MNPESLIIGGLCFGSSLTREESMIFLEKVYSLGIRDVDTGSLYGNGNSEILIAEYIKKTGNKLRIHSKIGLEKSKGFIRRKLSQNLDLRRTPEIFFKVDNLFNS